MTNEKLLKIIQVAKVGRRTTLKLGNNKIKELPPEIGGLTSLMDIDMSGNKLAILKTAPNKKSHTSSQAQ